MKKVLCGLVLFLIMTGNIMSSSLPNCQKKQLFHNCFGTHTFDDGDTYIGEWKDISRHGLGIETTKSGLKYSGEWKKGYRDGLGVEIYPSGGKYVGEWKEGFWDGKGTYYYPNGTIHSGAFKDGYMYGLGTRITPNGKRKDDYYFATDTVEDYCKDQRFTKKNETSEECIIRIMDEINRDK